MVTKAILDYAIKGVELERASKKTVVKTRADMIVEMSAILVPCDDQ